MKATRYFSDYQSAYNYYGGNVVPSTEIALIGDGSYIFVSSDNAVSGNQQYFDVSMTNDEIVDTMTYTAYNNGVSYGESIGYAQGYAGGYSYGYSEGEASVPQPTGTAYITANTLEDVTSYAYAYCETQESEWQPVENMYATSLNDLIDGTKDSIDLYKGIIQSNFLKKPIYGDVDNPSLVTGYRYYWEEFMPVSVEEDGDIIIKTAAFEHEAIWSPETGWAGKYYDISLWFENLISNGQLISQLYGNIYPVVTNVTFKYMTEDIVVFDFEDLMYMNYNGDCSDSLLTVQQNGIIPIYKRCGVDVQVPEPTGTTYINANTLTDVTSYAYAYCEASAGDETLLNTVACQASQKGFENASMVLMWDGGNVDGFDTVSYEDSCLVDGLIDCTPYVDSFTENGVEQIGNHIISSGFTGFPAHITVSLNNGDKVGFGMYKNTWEEDPETGDSFVTGTYIYWLVEDTSDENTHWLTAEDGDGNYKLQWDAEVDPESGDTTGVTFSFSKVNS